MYFKIAESYPVSVSLAWLVATITFYDICRQFQGWPEGCLLSTSTPLLCHLEKADFSFTRMCPCGQDLLSHLHIQGRRKGREAALTCSNRKSFSVRKECIWEQLYKPVRSGGHGNEGFFSMLRYITSFLLFFPSKLPSSWNS